MSILLDTVKPTSGEAVAELTHMGLDVVMLTGDNSRTAEAIRKQVGLKRVVAEVLPEDKEREIRRLQGEGKKAVTKALKAVSGVNSMEVDLESKSATVEISGTVTDKMLCDAVEEADYEVVEIM